MHGKMLLGKEWKFHFLTYKEYKQGGRKEKNENFFKWKTFFYVIAACWICIQLIVDIVERFAFVKDDFHDIMSLVRDPQYNL